MICPFSASGGCGAAADLRHQFEEAARRRAVDGETRGVQIPGPLLDGDHFLVKGEQRVGVAGVDHGAFPLLPQAGQPGGELAGDRLAGQARELNPEGDLGRVAPDEIGRPAVIRERQASDQKGQSVGGEGGSHGPFVASTGMIL